MNTDISQNILNNLQKGNRIKTSNPSQGKKYQGNRTQIDEKHAAKLPSNIGPEKHVNQHDPNTKGNLKKDEIDKIVEI